MLVASAIELAGAAGAGSTSVQPPGSVGVGTGKLSDELTFGNKTKSNTKLLNQMQQRGWTEQLVKETVDNPYTTRVSTNLATNQTATVFYTSRGAYVIVDDVTKEVVQISSNIDPASWIPDKNIINPYRVKDN